MKVDAEVVRHIAHLARLQLTDEEQKTYAHQLSSIVAHVDQLEDLDTDEVEPFVHPLDSTNVFRADKPILSYERTVILENAPEHKDGYIIVPKIVE